MSDTVQTLMERRVRRRGPDWPGRLRARADTCLRARRPTAGWSVILRGALAVALAALGLSAAAPVHAADFTDVPPLHPYAAAISDLTGRGVVSGYADGTFRPDELVSRQQFAKMIVRSLGLPVSTADVHPFTDLPANTDPTDPLYPNNYVAVCRQRALLSSPSPTTFAPFADLSRAELIEAAARAAALPDPPAAYDPPFAAFSPDGYEWSRKAAYAGLLSGLVGIGPTFDFLAAASRGECAQILYDLARRGDAGGGLGAADTIPPPSDGNTPSSASGVGDTSAGEPAAAQSSSPTTTPSVSSPMQTGSRSLNTSALAGICAGVVAVFALALLFARRARRGRTKDRVPPASQKTETAPDVAAILREWAARGDGFAASLSSKESPGSAKAWEELLEAAEQARAARDSGNGGSNQPAPGPDRGRPVPERP